MAVIVPVGPRDILAGMLSLGVLAMSVAPTIGQSPSGDPPAENPYAATGAIPGSGAGLTVGYLVGHGGDPTLRLVTQSVIDEAAIAGLVLVRCGGDDGPHDPLACAAGLRRAGVDGVIAAFLDLAPDVAARVCAAYGRVPTVDLGPSPSPCGTALVTTDDHAEGWLAGARVAAAVSEQRGCAYDEIATLAGRPGDAADNRLAGLIEGFGSICGPVPEDRVRRLVGTAADASVGAAVSVLLATVPPNGLAVLLSDSDAPALEALAAVDAAGRTDAVRIGAVGGSSTAWPAIGCHPSWVADATSFPERSGRTLVPAIVDLLTGRDVPALMTFPVAVLDRATIRSHYPDVPAC